MVVVALKPESLGPYAPKPSELGQEIFTAAALWRALCGNPLGALFGGLGVRERAYGVAAWLPDLGFLRAVGRCRFRIPAVSF